MEKIDLRSGKFSEGQDICILERTKAAKPVKEIGSWSRSVMGASLERKIVVTVYLK
jgi:hypothetical protein